MKSIIAVLLAVCCFCVRPARAGIKSDRQSDGLSGPVKSLEVKKLSLSRKAGKWVEGAARASLRREYDEAGRKTEEAEYAGQSLTSRVRLVYHDKSDDPFCRKLKSDDNWNSSFSEEKRYNLSLFCEDHGSDFYRSVYIYDMTQKPEEPNRDGVDGILRSRFVSVTDKSGRTLLEYEFDGMGLLDFKKTFRYDKSGSPSEILKSTPADDPVEKQVFSFDESGRLMSKSVSDSNGVVLSRKKFIYKGGILSGESFTRHNTDGSVASRSEAVCDPDGNPLSESFYSGDSAGTYSHEYSYSYKSDSSGNWTRKTGTRMAVSYGKKISDKHEPPEVTTRSITYYPSKAE